MKDVITTIRIPSKLDNDLISVAKAMNRSKSYIIRDGIEKYVKELQEDVDDYTAALEALQYDGPIYTLEEIINKLGLENEMEDRT